MKAPIISKENGFIQVKVLGLKLFPMYIYVRDSDGILEVWSVPLGKHAKEGPTKRDLVKHADGHYFRIRAFANEGRNDVYEICAEKYLDASAHGKLEPQLDRVGYLVPS